MDAVTLYVLERERAQGWPARPGSNGSREPAARSMAGRVRCGTGAGRIAGSWAGYGAL